MRSAIFPMARKVSVGSKRAAGIVQICENNQARFRSDGAFDIGWINREAILESALEADDIRACQLRGEKHRLVRGMFDENIVAGFERACIGQIIRHGSADCRDDAFLRELCVACQGFPAEEPNRSREFVR